MSTTRLTVEVVSPDGPIWTGEATFVLLPASDGEMGILPGHESFVGILIEGTARLSLSPSSHLALEIRGGFAFVRDDHVSILPDHDTEAIPLD